MSLSRAMPRNILTALALLAPMLLSACTLAPVYGTGADPGQDYRLSYAEPASRLDQIIYQDLGLRFGRGQGPGAAELKVVSVVSGSRVLARAATIDPQKAYEVTVSAQITLTRDGAVLFSGTRQSTATYTERGQALTDRAAAAAAGEQAAHALAETIRLTVIAALADAG